MPDSPANPRTVLIVRHGRNRGPYIRLRSFRPGYFDPFLQELASFDPQLHQRVVTWDTGTAEPDLSGVGAILFLLQDPLAQKYPECFGESSQLADRALRRGIRLANPPQALSRSKSEQAEIWRQAGLPTPEPHRFRDRRELLHLASQMEFPVLLKHDLLHVQSAMRRVDSFEELRKLQDANLPCPGSVCSFVDTRNDYLRVAPESPFASHFHKKRALVFGQTVVTNHLFFSANPIVGSRTSTFSHGRSLNPIRRWWGIKNHHEHLRLDYEFWEKKTEHETELLQAARVLGFEFVAIDYSTFADGSCVLWEANPHFALHLWPLGIYAHKRRLRQRIRRQHAVLARYLRDLVDP